MFTKPYKAAVIQMNSQTDVDANLEQAHEFIKQAAEGGAEVVGLPEYFSFLGGLSMQMKKVKKIEEKTSSFLLNTAQEFGIYLMGGSYPVPAENGKSYNHSSLIDPDGKILSSYDKIHLFDADLSGDKSYRESDFLKSGPAKTVLSGDNTIGRWGLSICYDMRFPELYRRLTMQGAQILSIPSAFTHTTGQAHWRPLLRARAIENTSYVFAPAQTGQHGPDRRTWGHSLIIDPWGEVIIDAGTEPGIAMAEINPAKLTEVRKSIPSLKHRRL